MSIAVIALSGVVISAIIATYSAAAHGLFYKAKTEDWEKGASVEYFAQLREFQDLKALLKLQLNPKNEIDVNIIRFVSHFDCPLGCYVRLSRIRRSQRLCLQL
jgi:hypothetical protein